jgi:hypothetical protein
VGLGFSLLKDRACQKQPHSQLYLAAAATQTFAENTGEAARAPPKDEQSDNHRQRPSTSADGDDIFVQDIGKERLRVKFEVADSHRG